MEITQLSPEEGSWKRKLSSQDPVRLQLGWRNQEWHGRDGLDFQGEGQLFPQKDSTWQQLESGW